MHQDKVSETPTPNLIWSWTMAETHEAMTFTKPWLWLGEIILSFCRILICCIFFPESSRMCSHHLALSIWHHPLCAYKTSEKLSKFFTPSQLQTTPTPRKFTHVDWAQHWNLVIMTIWHQRQDLSRKQGRSWWQRILQTTGETLMLENTSVNRGEVDNRRSWC